MATKKKSSLNKQASGGNKGRVSPNVPYAGIRTNKKSKYCGGGKKKACGGTKH